MTRQVLRVLVFLTGVFLIALAVAISVRANLGTAPIASLAAVLSFATPLTVGTYVMLLNFVFLGLQVLVLRRKFKAFQLLQLPMTIVFGAFIDLCMYLTWWLDPSSYLEQWAWVIASAIIMALGIYVEMQPRLIYLPANGIVFTLYTVLQNIPYGTIKIVFDTILVSIAVITSLTLLGGLYGVREGTVFAALAVGAVIRVISRIHQRIRGTSADD